jgi:hypothetical protein
MTPSSGAWPVVLITAPVDKYIGGAVNPYAYTVPASSANFVRALVFDTAASPQVSYRIDGGTTWYPMTRVASGSPVWQGPWNASGLAPGDHTIEVRAVSATTVSDSVKVGVTSAAPNRAPLASGESYTTDYNTALNVGAPGVLANDSDPDGNAITAVLKSGPFHGTLSLLNPDGGFTYTPGTGYSGHDSFSYTVSDGSLQSAQVTASITVTPSPTADTVTITTATWTRKTKTLVVEATSTAAPSAKLTVVGFGEMSYGTGTNRYTYQKTPSSKPASVTVTSDKGGSATKTVTTK